MISVRVHGCFLGKFNLETGRLLVDDPNHPPRMYFHVFWLNDLDFTQELIGQSMIYNNGYAQYYYFNYF